MEGEGRESGRGRGGERMRGKRGERGWEGKGGERVRGKRGERGWEGKGESGWEGKGEREGGRGRGREEEGTQIGGMSVMLAWRSPHSSPPELDHIEAVGENDVRLPLQQILCLLSCYLGNGAEDVCAVCGRPLQTVAVVDLSVACLLVHIELQTGHMTHEYHYKGDSST